MPNLIPDANVDHQRAQENIQAYAYSRDNGHLRYRDKAQRCEAFLAGRQWDLDSLTRLRRQRRPALTLNRVLAHYAAISGEQLANQADIGFKPADQYADQHTATVLNKTFINIGQQNNYNWLEAQMFDDGVISSRGFLDIRMNFETNLAGDIAIRLKNPQNIMIDPDADQYDPSTWNEVFESKWLSRQQIANMFGVEAANEVTSSGKVPYDYGYDHMDERPGTFGYSSYTGGFGTSSWQRWSNTSDRRRSQDGAPYRALYRLIDRQYKEVRQAEFFVDPLTGDMSQIPSGMPRERIQAILQEFDLIVLRKRADVIRWVTTCTNVLLHNDLSPYTHFTQVPYFPFFRHGETIGLIENMIDPQILYNKTRSQELHVISTTANSGWISKQNSVKNMTDEELEERGAETGLHISVDDVANIKKITPNPIPTGLDRMGFLAAEDLAQISMVSESLRGFDRADVAAKAIQAKQAQGSSNFAKPMSNLNFTRELIAKRVLSLVQQFYTNTRVLRITGTLPGAKDEQIVINEMQATGEMLNNVTVGKYDAVATSVPARETHAETQFEQGLALRKLGVPVPNSFLVRNSHLEGKQELADQFAEQENPEEGTTIDEQIAALEVRAKQLENEKIEAEKQRIESETAMNLVKARKEATSPTEEQVQSQEFQLEQAKFLAEREQALAELEQKEQEINNELMVNLEELRLKREQQRMDATQSVIKLDTERRKLVTQSGARARQGE